MRAATEDQLAAARAGDAVGVIVNNRRFHFAVFELCDNALLLRFVRQTWDSLDPHRAVSYRRGMAAGDTSRSEQIHREHRQIVEALAEGRRDDAVELLREHRHGGRDSFRHYLGAAAGESGESKV